MNGLRLGLTFLTRVPIAASAPAPGDWGRALRWFPLAGVLVATVSMGTLLVGTILYTPLVGAVGAVIAMVWITGGLHLDGFSDCLDGMYCNGDRTRILEVMRDPRAGAVGAAGTALLLMAKVALVSACVDAGTGAAAVWAACVLSRAVLPLEIVLGVPATPGKGLFARLAGDATYADAAFSSILAGVLVAPALALVPSLGTGLGVGLAGAGALSIAWSASWRDRIGGVTGDVLGAAVELREIVLLMGMATTWLA